LKVQYTPVKWDVKRRYKNNFIRTVRLKLDKKIRRTKNNFRLKFSKMFALKPASTKTFLPL